MVESKWQILNSAKAQSKHFYFLYSVYKAQGFTDTQGKLARWMGSISIPVAWNTEPAFLIEQVYFMVTLALASENKYMSVYI